MIPIIADAANPYSNGELVTKATPTATPISPAIKLTIRRILLMIIRTWSESLRITPHTKRHRADNADIIQAIVTNARETIILLHEGRIAGVASEHVDTKLSQKVIPPIGAHPYHKPMVDFLSPISLDPLKHIQNLVDFCFNKNLD